MSNYPRGSEWRKWDLHIHTPESFHWNEGKRFPDMNAVEKEEKIKEILKKINESDVAVFAVVDYWTFEGYIALREYITGNPGSLAEGKLILPGIELRVEAPVDYRLNMQLMFDDGLTSQCLRDFRQKLEIRSIKRSISDEALIQFARSLGADKAELHGKQGYMDDDETALLLGSMTAEVTRESLEEAISSLPSRDRCLVVMPYDTSDGLADLDWKAHPQADNYFLQFADVFESRDQKTKDLFNGIKTEDNTGFFDNFYKSIGGTPHPVICGSDGHRVSEYGVFPSNKATWIKADPSFEGLRQIIYEPEIRVSIQQESPEAEYLKNCFNSFKVSGNLIAGEELKFEGEEIELNRDLVTIIGGRGTGKSILLDCLLKTLNPERKDEDRVKEIHPEEFSVNLSLGDGEGKVFDISAPERFDYLHVRQGDIKEKVKTPKSLSDSIKRMLNIVEDDYSEDSDSKSFEALSLFQRACDFLEEKSDEHILVNNAETVEEKIKSIKGLIETLTTDTNKSMVEEYRDINSNIENINILLKKLALNKERLLDKVASLNKDIAEVNQAEDIDPKISLVDVSVTLKGIDDNSQRINDNKNMLVSRRDEIKESFAKQGLNQDVGGLLDKVGVYESQIQKLEELKLRVQKVEGEKNDQALAISKNVIDRIDRLAGRVDDIHNSYSALKEGREGWTEDQTQLIIDLLSDVEVAGEVEFNGVAFYEGLARIMNGNKFKPTSTQSSFDRLEGFFGVSSIDDYKRLLSGDLKIELDDDTSVTIYELSRLEEYFNSSSVSLLEYMTQSKYQKSYASVNAKVKYKGKTPEKLSVGQRGTFYLCMKLATDPFGSPFVFDQPEDDLDNEFIVEELVPIFKKIKKYRQVIIATHNANLVVNADAEQVIVARNNEESLSYFTGSLEHTLELPEFGIRENVCKVLEGGKDAFSKREMKYGMS
jgi:ABC-type lipoprotein export system ATPase subunit